jgi:hypothetical protein
MSTTLVRTRATILPVVGSSLDSDQSGLIAQTAPPATTRESPWLAPSPLEGSRVVPRTPKVSGSTRETLDRIGPAPPIVSLRTPFPIQTAPSPTARSVGVVPMLNVFWAFDLRSIRVIVWSSALSAQSAPSAKPRVVGLLPTTACATGLLLPGSMICLGLAVLAIALGHETIRTA